MVDLFLYLTPELLIILLASAAYVVAAWLGPARLWPWWALVTLACAAGALAVVSGMEGPEDTAAAAVRAVSYDSFAVTLRWLALASGLAIVAMAWYRAELATAGEYYASLVLLVAGLGLVAAANDLVLLFASLELISIPTYVLLYMERRDLEAREAAAKYFYLSVLASALFLFGAALAYGVTGSTNFRAMHELLLDPDRLSTSVPSLGPMAIGLLLAGVGFKMAAVPFHFYAGDVYQGTSNVMAAALSWFPKAAGLVAAVRVLVFALPGLEREVAWLSWVIAVATMTLGNTMALLQTNVRRLMAFSGVAHAGYMLVGLGAASLQAPPGAWFRGVDSLVLYLVSYALMTIGFFAVVELFGQNPGGRRIESIDDFAGLGQQAPLPAALATVLLISLIGLPFTLGFWGKLSVFYAAIATRDARYVVLAVIGLLNAAIGAFYYLRIIAYMYLRSGYGRVEYRAASPTFAVVVITAALTLLLGIWPRPVAQLAYRSATAVQGAFARQIPEHTRRHDVRRQVSTRPFRPTAVQAAVGAGHAAEY